MTEETRRREKGDGRRPGVRPTGGGGDGRSLSHRESGEAYRIENLSADTYEPLFLLIFHANQNCIG